MCLCCSAIIDTIDIYMVIMQSGVSVLEGLVLERVLHTTETRECTRYTGGCGDTHISRVRYMAHGSNPWIIQKDLGGKKTRIFDYDKKTLKI